MCVGIVYFNAAIINEKPHKNTNTSKTNIQKFLSALYFFARINPKITNIVAKTANMKTIIK